MAMRTDSTSTCEGGSTGHLLPATVGEQGLETAAEGPSSARSLAPGAIAAIVMALTFMLAISPTLTFWAVLPMPVLAVSVFFVSRLVHVRTDRQQKAYSGLTSRVQEALSGIRVVKAYAQEETWGKRIDDASEDYQARALDLALVDAAFRPVLMILIGFREEVQMTILYNIG